MKTPIQELIETFEEMRSPIDSKVDVDFAISLMKSMLEKEEEVMCGIYDDAIAQFDPTYIGREKYGEQYYNETFNTKEK